MGTPTYLHSTIAILLLAVLHPSVSPAKEPAGPSASALPKESAKLSVNVKQSGAVGDGIADDTVAMQSALHGGGRTVVIPKGTYKISDTLRLDSNTTIQADPHAVIRLADHAGKNVDTFLLANRDS